MSLFEILWNFFQTIPKLTANILTELPVYLELQYFIPPKTISSELILLDERAISIHSSMAVHHSYSGK